MHVAHLTLHEFRSYADLDLELDAGATTFLGRNGQGKTNLVEAVDYLSSLSSHRVASDAPLVRQGSEQAVVRAAVVREGRRAVLEVEINPGRSNRARVNRAALTRPRELLGLVRTVVFSPEDLALVKGDPSERRRFADALLVQLTPSYAGLRADYDRVLKQRNSLLKTAAVARRSGRSPGGETTATLEVWDANLAELGGRVMAKRAALATGLEPLLGEAYESLARGATREDATVTYKPSFVPEPGTGEAGELTEAMLAAIEERRHEELDRGVSLVGPHRDDLVLQLGRMPVKGYASHGETWSVALGLRLASYELIRAGGFAGSYADDPILVLDDVFAELDDARRGQLADLVTKAEQVLITAAVAEDVPTSLRGNRFQVAGGTVTRDG